MKRLIEQAKQDHVSVSSNGAGNIGSGRWARAPRMRVIKVKKQSQVAQANSVTVATI